MFLRVDRKGTKVLLEMRFANETPRGVRHTLNVRVRRLVNSSRRARGSRRAPRVQMKSDVGAFVLGHENVSREMTRIFGKASSSSVQVTF